MKPKKQAQFTLPQAVLGLTFLCCLLGAVVIGNVGGGILVGLGLLAVILVTLFPALLRHNILAQLGAPIEFAPASLEDFPQCDRATIEAHTAALRQLGFLEPQDETYTALMPVLARFLVHPQAGCIAEIYQIFPNTRTALPVSLGISSYFGTEANLHEAPLHEPSKFSPIAEPGPVVPLPFANEPVIHGYSLLTTNRPGNWVMRLLYHEKALGFRMEGATAPELFQQHLRLKEQVEKRLGIPAIQTRLVLTQHVMTVRYRMALHARLQPRWSIPTIGGAWLRGKPPKSYYGELGRLD